MSWLLDADVLSQPAKRRGDASVIAWLEREEDDCHTSTVVIAQLAYWVRTKEGKQREALQRWLRQLLDAWMVVCSGAACPWHMSGLNNSTRSIEPGRGCRLPTATLPQPHGATA